MKWSVKIYKINASTEELYAFADYIKEIKGVHLLNKQIRPTINDNGFMGFLAIICKIEAATVEEMKAICRLILKQMSGELKIAASSMIKESTDITMPSIARTWYFSKTNSIWGITVYKPSNSAKVNNEIEKYLSDNIKNPFYFLVGDSVYNNYVVLASEFELENMHNYNGFSVVPFLAGDIEKIHFPKRKDKVEYKAISVPNSYIDISGDDISLDRRFW